NIYTSTDLINWTYVGQPFDATTTSWQNYCAGTGSGGGCGASKIIYNAANQNWLLWINQFGGNTTYTTDGMLVETCTTPAGPCTGPTIPTALVHSASGDFGLAVDGSANAFIAYSALSTNRHIYVEALNANYTDSAGGTSVDVSGAVDEGAAMFVAGGKYFVTFGGPCGYCNTGANLYYAAASSALGTYSAPSELNAASTCQSQPRAVNTIIAGASTIYLAVQDQWSNTNNNGSANEYYQPLTVSGSTISTFACQQSVTVAGLTAGSSPSQPGVDQTSIPGPFFQTTNAIVGAIGGSGWRMQTFVPTSASLDHINIELGQACNAGDGDCAGLGSATVTVTLNAVTGSPPVPSTPLASVTFTASQMQWTGRFMKAVFSYSGLTPGTTYAFVISSPSAAHNVISAGIYTPTS